MDEITELKTRIAELEAELAKLRASKPRRRSAATPECQYCCDTKTPKVSFLGLPVCAEWKPCASRIGRRRKAGSAGFAYDMRYTVAPDSESGVWVATFNGETIMRDKDRAVCRQAAMTHRAEQADEIAA